MPLMVLREFAEQTGVVAADVAEGLRGFCRASREPQLRTMREFAEQEIIIPNGPFEGRPYSVRHQPYAGLLLDEIDSGAWERVAALGPSQSGKTLTAFCIPTLWHLLEAGESVIAGLPSQEMANDKWQDDLLPVIERTRYRVLLPRSGEGSRGGKVREAVRFRNGATLRFMSGGGDDKSRAHYTARVLVVTEADGLDKASATSREADPLKQLEARTRSFGASRRIYLECTVSTEDGRIWREYQAGSGSRLALPCPKCRRYVTPEREHFRGWEGAADELTASAGGRFHCPSCGAAWTDAARTRANARAVLVHRGQEVGARGKVTGKPPRTRTLGFRWTATNNLFWASSDVALDEHRASRATDEENAEREMRQFIWALPHVPSERALADLQPLAIQRRTEPDLPRGRLPVDVEQLTVGIDIGKWLAHWTAVAWRSDGSGHVVDYGVIEVPSADMPVADALLVALRGFREDYTQKGWETAEGETLAPAAVWIDAGWEPDAVYQFVTESNGDQAGPYWPTKGHGEETTTYRPPSDKSKNVKAVGEQYHLSALPTKAVYLVVLNVDHWKTRVHGALTVPLTGEGGERTPGALGLYNPVQRAGHLSFSRHLTAEKAVEEFVPSKGTRIVWRRAHRNNHWLDAVTLAFGAGHLATALARRPARRRKPPGA